MGKKNILIFGATGSIGSHIMKYFESEQNNFTCFGTTSKYSVESNKNYYHVSINDMSQLEDIEPINGIVWAQGYNCNDTIYSYDGVSFINSIQTNVEFITVTLSYLLNNKKICPGAKLVIISSIFENTSRENKLSYSISKSALSGLVKNLSYDLAKNGILINNVLPGVVYNEMTQMTLSDEQINYIKNYTPFNRMVSLDDILHTVKFLLLENTGITGQSITVDLGFSNIRKYS